MSGSSAGSSKGNKKVKGDEASRLQSYNETKYIEEDDGSGADSLRSAPKEEKQPPATEGGLAG